MSRVAVISTESIVSFATARTQTVVPPRRSRLARAGHARHIVEVNTLDESWLTRKHAGFGVEMSLWFGVARARTRFAPDA